MTQARGSKGSVTLAYETSYGANPSPVAGIGPMPFHRFGLKASQQENASETIVDSINPTPPWRGNLDARGQIVVPVDAVVMGYWLKAMLGTEVSVVTGSKSATAVTADAVTDKITLASHGLSNGQCITVAGTAVPGGLAAGTRYYLVNKGTDDFELAITPSGTKIDITSTGTDVTITTVCSHVFKMSADMPSLVLEEAWAAITDYNLFNGCKCSGFSLDIGNDNSELTLAMDFVGSGKYTNSTSAYDGSRSSPGSLVVLNKFQAAITQGGSALANGTQFSLSVDFDLDDGQYVIGGLGYRGDIPQGKARVTGKLTTLYEGPATTLTKAIAETETSLVVTLTNGSYVLAITLPEVKYSLDGPVIDGPRGVQLPLNFVAFKDNADQATALQVELVNLRATAY